MMPAARRRAYNTAALAGAVAITLGVASLVSRHFFEGPSRELPPRHPHAAGLAPPAGAVPLFRVAAIEGPVEAFHNNQWYVVQAGDQLSLQDLIRTPRGSTALLRRGGTEIEVREGVDIRLDEIAAETATFGVLRGNVVANVDDARERLQINAHETKTYNQGVARFVVRLEESGQVSVAAAKGDVRFAAQGKEVALRAGTESTALPGRAPGDPEPIPEDLLLSVIWPELEHSESDAEVSGKVRPTSRVKVNGVETPTKTDGSFSSSVPLAVGPNDVEVQAEDILGRKKTLRKVLKRPAPVPTLQHADEDLWKK
jgi:hypothetical protein